MADKNALAAKLDLLKRVDGMAALPPRGAEAAGASPDPKGRKGALADVLSGTGSADAALFEKAGWAFVAEKPERGGPARPVFVDADGHLKIDGGSLTVRFAEGASEAEIEGVLAGAGLSIRRKLKFAPNLFTVAPTGGEGADSVGAARALSASEAVEYAEPVLIEPLAGRDG